MEGDIRPFTGHGQWDPDSWPETVVWRGEYSERWQAEVQQTAAGMGVLAVFDRKFDSRKDLATPVPLPEVVTDADAEYWDWLVRKHVYAPQPRPFAIRNTYRRGRRK